jgi:general secretion pathway protein L
MSDINSPALFFGMDLSRLRQDWMVAINEIAAWPPFRWLAPDFVTRLKLPNGDTADFVDASRGASKVARQTGKARFAGYLLPNDLVLWHKMQLPKLSPDAVRSAVELQARSVSPFNSDDVVWAYQASNTADQTSETSVAITSRKLVSKQIESLGANSAGLKDSEVWAQMPDGKDFLVLNGFGENLRKRYAMKWRAVNTGLLALLVAIGVAAAVTPTLQLRNRALQADQEYSKLRALTDPIVHQREMFLRQDLQVKALQSQLESRIDVVQMLPKITKLLPDDTYLSILKVQDSKFSLNGETPNTAALMQLLGAQTGIKDVKAPAAAVKPRGSERETFNIEFTLETPGTVRKP